MVSSITLLPFKNSADREYCMGPLTAPDRPRRPGRPPSKFRKVTITIRIPEEVDSFLTNYSGEHGLFKGDVISDAVVKQFRLKRRRAGALAASAI